MIISLLECNWEEGIVLKYEKMLAVRYMHPFSIEFVSHCMANE